MTEEIAPCLTDLVRDWMDDKPELDKIIIHKIADDRAAATSEVVGRIIIPSSSGGYWTPGYIEDTFVEIEYVDNDNKIVSSFTYAADPEFFDKLYKDFLQIIEIGAIR